MDRQLLLPSAPTSGILLPEAQEPLWKRRSYGLLAVAFLAIFFAYHHSFWAPAHPGVDQNGYLVGGKQLARTGTTELNLKNAKGEVDPFKFIGLMWVGTDYNTPRERYYPKYPVGLPLLVAAALKLGGAKHGLVLTYYISPISMTLAIGAVFLIVRRVAGSFMGLLGMIALAFSPGILGFVNNPNSHAATLFCVTGGMYLLIRWWQENEKVGEREELRRPLLSAVTACMAGLLLGYAGTIRYTELTLLLPLAAAACLNLRPKSGRSWIESFLLLAWWALPVIFLFIFNLKTLGSWTGYDPTHESDKSFQWEYFHQNWEPMIRQIAGMGLFLIAPLGLAGLVGMFFVRWKMALVLTLWLLPNLTIYSFYYWAPDQDDLGYIRFFLTGFPVFVISTFWLFAQIRLIPEKSATPRQRMGIVIGCAIAWVVPFVAFAHLAGIVDPASGRGIYAASHLFFYGITRFAYQTLHLGALHGGFALSVVVGTLLWLIPFVLLALLSRWLDRGLAVRRAHIAAVVTAGFVLGVAMLEDHVAVGQTQAHDHYLISQLAETTQRILEDRRPERDPVTGKHELLVPPGSYVFCGGLFSSMGRSMPNHLQFAGDYEVYSAELFSYDVVHGMFFRGGRDRDPDHVQVIDAARSKATYDRLRNLSREELQNAERKIIFDALDSKHPVLYLGKIDDGSMWTARIIPADITGLLRPAVKSGPKPPADLEAELMDSWTPMLIAPKPERTTVQGRAGNPFLFWDRTAAWQIIEIRRAKAKPVEESLDDTSSTIPITRGATRPTTTSKTGKGVFNWLTSRPARPARPATTQAAE